MAERFTKDQKTLYECMKDLISLYYMEKTRPPDETTWYPGEVGPFLIRLFERFYPDCELEQSEEHLRISYVPSRGAFISHSTCSINPRDWSKFVNIFDELIKAEKQGDKKHFKVSRMIDELATKVELADGTRTFPSPNGPITLTADEYETVWTADDPETAINAFASLETGDIVPQPTVLIKKLALSAMRKMKTTTHQLDRIHTLECVPGRFMWVEGITDFARTVFESDIDYVIGDEADYKLPPLALFHISYFIPFIVALLINFDIEFNGFERIKSCGHCGRIFIEKRKGTGIFCSSGCRRERHYAQEPRERRQCRDRQNHWIRYEMDNNLNLPSTLTPKTLMKDDCSECDHSLKGGQCNILRSKNPRVFS